MHPAFFSPLRTAKGTSPPAKEKERKMEKTLLTASEVETVEERHKRLKNAEKLTTESSVGDLLVATLPTCLYELADGKLKRKKLKAPKASVLEKYDAEVIITYENDEITLKVYDIGFYVAKQLESGHTTTGSVDGVLKRLGVVGDEKKKAEVLNKPWHEVLGIDASCRFDHNEENREANKVALSLRMDGTDTIKGATVPDWITQKEMEEKEKSREVMNSEMRRGLPKALKALREHSEKQYLVVLGRICSAKPVPYKELSEQLGVAVSRVSALKDDGLKFLKKYMGEDKELSAHIKEYEE